MANTETSYQINYQGQDIQKQLDYVNSVKDIIKKGEKDNVITIDSLNSITLKTDALTTNTLTINSAMITTDATITNNIKASAFHTANNGHLTDTGLTTPTINVAKDNSNQTYITPNAVRTKTIYLGTSSGGAEIGSWNKTNGSTGGQIYGLTIASPIYFDVNSVNIENAPPNALRINNIATTLELPDENNPFKNTITHSFGKIVHQINYISSLENFLPITKDENNSSVSRINLNNISTITANIINVSSATLGNIYSSGTTTLSALNASQINSDALVMSESSYATIPTATINNLTLNERIDANKATATFNDINTTTLSATSASLGDTITNNAQIFDLTVNDNLTVNAKNATFNNIQTSTLSTSSTNVENANITNASITALNVDTIVAPAYNYVSTYQPIAENIEINNNTYNACNGILLIANSSDNLTILLSEDVGGNMEFEVLRFGVGAVNITSTSTNIIANEKLTSTAQIKKQYDVIGVKNFIVNDIMYWLITGNTSA